MPPRSSAPEFVVDFPTLWVALEWAMAHCVIPDGFSAGEPFVFADWQAWYFANFYRIRPDATLGAGGHPVGAPAFFYRRAQVVMPQKALALDTPIATPSGWTTMGDLRLGDEVFDEHGQRTEVVSKSPVWSDATYRVTFSDGASLVACGDHEWIVDRRTPSATYVRERLSTKQILATGLVDDDGARRFRVPVAAPIDTPARDLPIDPYTLGAWLGDGGAHDARITGLDLEVFEGIAAAGYKVAQDEKISKRWQVYGLRRQLRLAGLLQNKHIPAPYLRSSISQRWALLQGLMDTDGSCDSRQGKCEFTTTTPALRDGISELLHSLGIRHAIYEGMARLNGRATGPKWRVSFAARSDSRIFRIQRKQARLRHADGNHAQYRHRRIVSIEMVDTVETQCITVASAAHSFLAGREMIPTGNSGKGPMTAAHCCIEGVGPAMFAGFAEGGELYRCIDNMCGCGWEYEYEPGEAMGALWPSPLIQITAYSEEQTGNVYDALRPMIEKGPLTSVIPKTGEAFIRLPNDGRIDIVTSNAQSRLGQRVTFVPQDETGIWTATNKMINVAKTQRRGAAGMQGRTAETTNGWDPSEQSVAQQTADAAMRVKDIFRLHRLAPPKADGTPLNFMDKRERMRILAYVYRGCSWIDLNTINAEAEELMLLDPGNAERFYGNRIVPGFGAWLKPGLWESKAERTRLVPEGSEIALGFDGSESDDWTAIRAETKDGFSFTPHYGPDRRPTWWDPKEWGGSIPRGEVMAAVDELFRRYKVRKMYCDPRDWQSEIGEWALAHGDDVVFEWATYRIAPMHDALNRAVTDLISGRRRHDGDPIVQQHMDNARKIAKPAERYILGKPDQARKIDLAMADTLAHEAASDWREEPEVHKGLTRVTGRTRAY